MSQDIHRAPPSLTMVDEPPTAGAVRDLAIYVWDDDAAAERWLASRHPLLDNQAPADILETRKGAQRVADLLRALHYGTPV